MISSPTFGWRDGLVTPSRHVVGVIWRALPYGLHASPAAVLLNNGPGGALDYDWGYDEHYHAAIRALRRAAANQLNLQLSPGFAVHATSQPFAQAVVRIPLWAPTVLLLAAGPGTMMVSANRRRRRRRQGRGVRCGYDLRGCADGRCSECGHVAPAAGEGCARGRPIRDANREGIAYPTRGRHGTPSR
ncbi:MAG: hypothetical protein C4547_02350 [Phycisphaerales bacterium]|nr:MAG: hypothetical protein C4547_02350 [Phycisphaerales bacterium]